MFLKQQNCFFHRCNNSTYDIAGGQSDVLIEGHQKKINEHPKCMLLLKLAYCFRLEVMSCFDA
jgi:hypothetical protein